MTKLEDILLFATSYAERTECNMSVENYNENFGELEVVFSKDGDSYTMKVRVFVNEIIVEEYSDDCDYYNLDSYSSVEEVKKWCLI